MKYYTGFNAGYNMDDFVKNRMTIVKTFNMGDIRYRLWYVTDQRFITIVKSKGIQSYQYTVSIKMLNDVCYFDMVEKVCDDIKAVGFAEITS